MTDGDEIDATPPDPRVERDPARPIPPTYVVHRWAAAVLVVIIGLLAAWLAYGIDVITVVANLVPGWFDLLWPF